jgi:hypothetical protein
MSSCLLLCLQVVWCTPHNDCVLAGLPGYLPLLICLTSSTRLLREHTEARFTIDVSYTQNQAWQFWVQTEPCRACVCEWH